MSNFLNFEIEEFNSYHKIISQVSVINVLNYNITQYIKFF